MVFNRVSTGIFALIGLCAVLMYGNILVNIVFASNLRIVFDNIILLACGGLMLGCVACIFVVLFIFKYLFE